MNYSNWTKQATRTIDLIRQKGGVVEMKVLPPLSPENVRDLTWNLKHIPGELMDFWLTGSSKISCTYFWNPPGSERELLTEVFASNTHFLFGGINFRNADLIFPGNSGNFFEGMEEFRETVGDKALGWWQECAIFHDSMNGDCLALGTNMGDDPPVFYLSQKDDQSKMIADHFSEFLNDWEHLCFIGPQSLLDSWLDPAGRINTTLHKTDELRKLLLY